MHRVAIEISKSSVWLVSGSSSGGRVQLDHLLHKSLAAPADAPAALAELARTAGVRGSKCVAIVRRSDAEVRTALLPSTELNELPDMVRFSATRLFANAGETWPIDFLVLAKTKMADGDDAVEQTNALVTAVPPTLLNQLKSCCTTAGLELQSVFLAPVVAANAVLRCSTVDVDDTSAFLVADGYESGSELTICDAGKVHFLRSVRTPLNRTESDINVFSGEIKRTSMAAADSELPVHFDTVVALGIDPEQGTALSGLINKPVTVVPMDALLKLDRLKADDQANVGRSGWITLALALAEPVTAKIDRPIESREIDYLNPRHAIIAKRSLPMMIAIGGGVAAILLGAIVLFFLSHSSLDRQIAELRQQDTDAKKNLEIAEKLLQEKSEVESFLNTDFNWLDELAYVSTKALPADKAVITEVDAQVMVKNNLTSTGASSVTTATVRLPTFVVENSTGTLLERELRDDNHSIQTGNWAQVASEGIYRSSGSPTITVLASGKTQWQLPNLPAAAPQQTQSPAPVNEPNPQQSSPAAEPKTTEPTAEPKSAAPAAEEKKEPDASETKEEPKQTEMKQADAKPEQDVKQGEPS